MKLYSVENENYDCQLTVGKLFRRSFFSVNILFFDVEKGASKKLDMTHWYLLWDTFKNFLIPWNRLKNLQQFYYVLLQYISCISSKLSVKQTILIVSDAWRLFSNQSSKSTNQKRNKSIFIGFVWTYSICVNVFRHLPRAQCTTSTYAHVSQTEFIVQFANWNAINIDTSPFYPSVTNSLTNWFRFIKLYIKAI